jgi:hypothetical protein
MNRVNLEKLAAHLEKLPEDYTNFDMRMFFTRDGTDRPYWDATLAGDCGTVACAIGHGPAAGITIATETADWLDYGEKAFELALDEWDWCFSGHWCEVDNTPHGAAKRIRYFLEHGVPADAEAQRYGQAPYLFAKEEEEA